jgi:hypothetical protein
LCGDLPLPLHDPLLLRVELLPLLLEHLTAHHGVLVDGLSTEATPTPLGAIDEVGLIEIVIEFLDWLSKYIYIKLYVLRYALCECRYIIMVVWV